MKGKKIVTINSTIPLLWKEEIIGALEIARDITYLKGLSDQLLDLQYKLKNNDYKTKRKIRSYTFGDIIGKAENIKYGTLRKDLYYRLNVIYINIPPLKERKEDIPILSNHFIDKYNFY